MEKPLKLDSNQSKHLIVIKESNVIFIVVFGACLSFGLCVIQERIEGGREKVERRKKKVSDS